MYFGVMTAGPSWCLLDLDACRKFVGLLFNLIGAPSLSSRMQHKIAGTSTFQKRPFVHNSVCSQFLEGLFAILAECSQFCLRSFNRNSRGNPSFCWLGGGGVNGHENYEKNILWTNWRFLPYRAIDFQVSFHRRKIHPKKSTQNRKVHLNKFFRTISVGFLTRVTGKNAKVRANFSKKFL